MNEKQTQTKALKELAKSVHTILDTKNAKPVTTLKKKAQRKYYLASLIKSIQKELTLCPNFPLPKKLIFIKKTVIPLVTEYFYLLKSLPIDHMLIKITSFTTTQLQQELEAIYSFKSQEKRLFAYALLDDAEVTLDIFSTPASLEEYPYKAFVNEHFPFLAITRAYFKALDMITEDIKLAINSIDKRELISPPLQWMHKEKTLYELAHYLHKHNAINSKEVSFQTFLEHIDVLFRTNLSHNRIRHTSYECVRKLFTPTENCDLELIFY